MERNVDLIKEWFEQGDGREIIKNLLPEQEEKVLKYLNIPQFLNRREISGVYHFLFTKDGKKHSAYIGEAGNVYFRLLEHIYNLFNNVTEWGVSAKSFLEGTVNIEWLCEVGIPDEKTRKEIENKKIEQFKPFLQYTAPDSPEYGKDKWQYGKTREEILSDYCVCNELRKKRAAKLFYINSI